MCDAIDAVRVADALASAERLDVLVNNAKTNTTEAFLEVSEENLDEMLALNVKGYFLVAWAAARRITERGSIVNVTSQMGHVGAPTRTVYCTTKHAVEGLTRAIAVEHAPRG